MKGSKRSLKLLEVEIHIVEKVTRQLRKQCFYPTFTPPPCWHFRIYTGDVKRLKSGNVFICWCENLHIIFLIRVDCLKKFIQILNPVLINIPPGVCPLSRIYRKEDKSSPQLPTVACRKGKVLTDVFFQIRTTPSKPTRENFVLTNLPI